MICRRSFHATAVCLFLGIATSSGHFGVGDHLTCLTTSGVAFLGSNVVPSILTVDDAACADLCVAMSSCFNFVYQDGLCNLKAEITGNVPADATTVSGDCGGVESEGLESVGCDIDYFSDYNGNDVAFNLNTGDATGCAALCSAMPLCSHFTFIWNKCYPKSSDAGKIYSNQGTSGACTSVAATPPPPPTGACSTEIGYDFFGADLQNGKVAASNAADCAQACLDRADCNAYSYIWGSCWLKSSDTGRTVKKQGVSGVCTRGTLQPTPAPASSEPTLNPSTSPATSEPTPNPSVAPATSQPTPSPSIAPATSEPTTSPITSVPTPAPTTNPSPQGSAPPTPSPTPAPSISPASTEPSHSPSSSPPSSMPTHSPTISPTTPEPSPSPTATPATSLPTSVPTYEPTLPPSRIPTNAPSTPEPTLLPTPNPTGLPSTPPTRLPTTETVSPTTPLPTPLPTGGTFVHLGNGCCRTQSNSGGDYDTTAATSVSECQQQCDAVEACTGIEFQPAKNQCEIHYETLSHTSSWSACTCYVRVAQTSSPSLSFTLPPSSSPTPLPSTFPTTSFPTSLPSSSQPTELPTTSAPVPSSAPTTEPSSFPSTAPSPLPTAHPSSVPTSLPSTSPFTSSPTTLPTTSSPVTAEPSSVPSSAPTLSPAEETTGQPTIIVQVPVYTEIEGCCRTANGGSGTLLKKTKLDTDQKCKDLCDATAGCVGIERNDDVCEIHGATIDHTAIVNNQNCRCFPKTYEPSGIAATTPSPTSTTETTPPQTPPPPPPPNTGGTSADMGVSFTVNVQGMPKTKHEAQGAVANNKLYVFGGFVNGYKKMDKKTMQYDPLTNQWTEKASMPLDIDGITHMANMVHGTDIILAGGLALTNGGSWPGGADAIKDVVVYHTTSNTWSTLPDLPQARGGNAGAVIGDILHVVGGATFGNGAHGFQTDKTTHWSLDLANPNAQWVTLAPMGVARNHVGCASYNGLLYAIGGQNLELEGCSNKKVIEVYDPVSDSWSYKANVPTEIGHISPSTFSTPYGIVIFGGVKNKNSGCAPPGKAINGVHHYDPYTNQWKFIGTGGKGGASAVSGVIGDAIYAQKGNDAYKIQLTWSNKVDYVVEGADSAIESTSVENGNSVAPLIGAVIAVALAVVATVAFGWKVSQSRTPFAIDAESDDQDITYELDYDTGDFVVGMSTTNSRHHYDLQA